MFKLHDSEMDAFLKSTNIYTYTYTQASNQASSHLSLMSYSAETDKAALEASLQEARAAKTRYVSIRTFENFADLKS
jgi:hypothetical protein